LRLIWGSPILATITTLSFGARKKLNVADDRLENPASLEKIRRSLNLRKRAFERYFDELIGT